MKRVTVWCAQAGKANTSGIPSTNSVAVVYPSCTVTVFLAGTVTKANIFSDNNTTPTIKSNPFVANNQGVGYFYAADGRYDVNYSGAGITQPFTVGDILLQDSSGATVGTISNQIPGTLPLATGTNDLTAPSHISEAGATEQVSQPLWVNANTSPPPTPDAGTVLNLAGADSTVAEVSLNAFSGAPILKFRRADGTNQTPTPPAAGSVIGSVSAGGYDGTAWSQSAARIEAVTFNPWTSSDHSTYMRFQTTPSGTTALTEAMRIDNNGRVGIGTTTPAFPLDVNGLAQATRLKATAMTPGAAPVCTLAADGTLSNVACAIPPTQVTWPASCSVGVYAPVSNSCVAPGTAANAAGSAGNLQMNGGGGTFAPVPGVNTDNANGLSVAGAVAAVGPLSGSTLSLSGAGCVAGAFTKGDGSGCGTVDLSSPPPIGSTTPNTAQFTSVNGIPAATLAYVDPTSSIQGQINTNAANIAANNAALAGKAASNASTTVNGVSCALSGTCTVTTAGLTPVGAWVSTNAYVPGNLVTYSGANYSCISGCVAGVTPTTTANWMPIYGTAISLSAAQTWTALQTFNGGVAGTRVSYSQATPANSAGFSNFGGAQNNGGSGLNGGLTIYDNGSSWSEGLTHILKGSFGMALYTNSTTQATNIWLCPSPTGTAYPTLQTSLNCPYAFAATGLTTTLPINVGGTTTTRVGASQATVANSAGFSNFGGSQNNGGSGLNGGITVLDNGGTWSEGMAAIFKSGPGLGFGTAVYATNTTQSTGVYLCPSPTGGTYPVLTTSFNCPYTFSATVGMSTSGLAIAAGAGTFSGNVATPEINASQPSPANTGGFSSFGNGFAGASSLGGGITVADSSTNYSDGIAAMFQGGHYGIGVYSNKISGAYSYGNVWLCPSPAGGVYPVNVGSFNCPYTFTAANATFGAPIITNGLTSNGPLAVASPSATVPGAATMSDPLAPNQAATSVFTTLMAKVRRELPPKALVTYSSQYHSFGDSITAGTGATSCGVGGDCYVQDVARGIGATATNFGFSGDYSCDASKKVFNNENPGASGNPVYTLMIGTNDLNVKGTGQYEQNYFLCQGAAASWLAVQSGSKVPGSTFTGSGFSLNSTYSQVTGVQSTTNGATSTGSITTFGGPIYLWYEIIDGNGGTFTYSVNGGPTTSVNSFPVVPIATTNGVTRSVAMLRIPPPPAGGQTITITVTSATGAGNIVSIIAIGTPQRNAYYTGPVVVIGSTPYQQFDGRSSGTGQYTLDALQNQQQLAADGLDVRFADIRSCMQDGMPAEMNDNYHPNPAGHQELANCYIPVLQSAPGRNVNRGTPANSSAACTTSDVWADGNYVYNCIKSGQIVRAALSSF